VHDIHQHQKLDCPDEAVYSCNGLTPLGLEYVCDPLPVLGYLTRRRSWRRGGQQPASSSSSSNGGGDSSRGRTTADDDGGADGMLEHAALVASRLNLASLEYRNAGGGVGDGLKNVLATLELASDDCRRATAEMAIAADDDDRAAGGDGCGGRSFFGLLEAVVHSNIGTVNYRLNRVRESLASYEAAEAALKRDGEAGASSCGGGRGFFDGGASSADAPDDGDDGGRKYAESHYDDGVDDDDDDDRFPPRDYLLLVVRLNLSRVLLRLNRPDDASRYRDMISADCSKNTRRDSSFRRSRSFASSAASTAMTTAVAAYEHDVARRSSWLRSVSEHYISGLIHEKTGESSDYKEAWHHYNRLLSLARVKLDHRHAYICAILERRGAVLFEQRKLQCSMLSYLACLKILEHQQSTGSNVFNGADLSRILYAVARVLHDKEEYHDALHMYQRALTCQRAIAAISGRPSLDVITTLCNISRVHHLSGEIDAALAANREVLDLSLVLVGGKVSSKQDYYLP
jgi:tetratricopeptide (TPR) repeat protein